MLNQPGLRAMVWQALLFALLAVGLWILVGNLNANLAQRGIDFGYDFLLGPAGFDIAEQAIQYDADSSYVRAFVVGLINTLRVAVVGIVLASLLGLLVAVGSLSPNPLLVLLCRQFVEFIRNVPLLLQLIFWYLTLAAALPDTEAPAQLLPHVFLSKNGLQFPWFLAGAFPALEYPEMGAFGLVGGAALSPEFIALLLGLSIYTSAFIAEIIRAGILAVPKGSDRGRRRPGLYPVAAIEVGGAAAGLAGHHSAHHKSVPQPHQEQQSGHCHRVSRPREHRHHHPEPVGQGGGGDLHRHGGLPQPVFADIDAHESV